MTRRDLFKGLAAAFVAAKIPLPFDEADMFGRSPAMDALPNMNIINYLTKVRLDIMRKIANPPIIMHEDGKFEIFPTDVQEEALRHVNALLEELA